MTKIIEAIEIQPSEGPSKIIKAGDGFLTRKGFNALIKTPGKWFRFKVEPVPSKDDFINCHYRLTVDPPIDSELSQKRKPRVRVRG